MFERFTDNSRRVMQFANQEAQRFGHANLGTEHVLLGLVKGAGIASEVLSNLDIDLQKTRKTVEQVVPQGQRTLSVLPSKDLHHEVHVPAGHSSLHDVAFLARMLFD